ncbi:hypothetical protein F8M41_024134 [Gigaspora margarita]|uniref:Uncharacterized protein n=1 Tax=Gigaspora margarita TaxID=4874 RepID=A0A8H4B0I0_GIGMA|nr:hypothetical protein F8M41_024134 [Gigaspora margarita]
MKLMFPTKQKDSFFLTNNINSDHVSWVLDIDKTPLNDESPVNVAYLEIKCSKAELIFDKESMKPSESLNKAVTSALEDKNPYHELTKIFNNMDIPCLEKSFLDTNYIEWLV